MPQIRQDHKQVLTECIAVVVGGMEWMDVQVIRTMRLVQMCVLRILDFGWRFIDVLR